MSKPNKIVVVKAETQAETQKNDHSDESLAYLIMIMMICMTLILTTRMILNTTTLSDMINNYSLRGKDIILNGDTITFIN